MATKQFRQLTGLFFVLGAVLVNIPYFPVIGWAGLSGSLLWLLWMVIIGVYLISVNAG